MKFLPSQLLYFCQNKAMRKNLRNLSKFLAVIAAAITVYSILFHFIMEYEGRQFSWITGFYWTLTVMSTLGFGDITFTSDLGFAFSMVVLLSGIVFLLIMLPFTFIRFFYAPWLESQAQSRTPRELHEGTENHLIITNYEPIAMSLIREMDQYGLKYAVVVQDTQAAEELLDLNVKVAVGELDKPETYQKLRVEKAALVFVNNDDMLNTNIIATIREVSESVPIITTADAYNSIDILELAGATQVFQFTRMLGVTMARHALGVSAQANIVGSLGGVFIAEAYASHTPYEGKELIKSGLREKTGVIVVGIWQRGKLEIPRPQTVIQSNSILLLAGSEEHFRRYNEYAGGSRDFVAPVVILGGGRVGQAAADTLDELGIDYHVVEKNVDSVKDDSRYIAGDAADIHALERAGISQESPSVLITTHDDDINIYLTIYCRELRPDIQIISRATRDRDISKLYSVGADIVMSYASMGASKILNILKPDEILMLAEGLNVFKTGVPDSLTEITLAESQIRRQTGCNVIAISAGDSFDVNPDPTVKLKKGEELILIGTAEAEREFKKVFS
ncbi:MAG: NAD-binding protein [Deltaproteobacteria bacterium]|jgi:Trk K+ transport system NAD-binding subunit|nr:NAD-binding protein [Deltaproteobacteria bacterium]